MIKLNNKNITYVALADSNNSLKAPKEIWYADSSNSVKLVYRRKDALIEGVDYEKYHWLKTTEYAYINTKIKGNQNSEIDVIAIQRSNPTAYAITLYGSVPDNLKSSISFNVSTIESGRNTRFGNRTILLADYKLNEEYTVSQSKDVLSVNGIVVSNMQASNTFESGEIYLFSSNITDDISPYLNRELWIRRFAIRNVVDLIPCKLLKPVPKWLDANGIRRQVGECGMIDLVSGKFYGNVNSVGTFTVENYYERKEWLQGRNGAYIDTNYIPLHSDSISCHYRYDGVTKNPDDEEQEIFGLYEKVSDDTIYRCRAYINSFNRLAVQFCLITDGFYETGEHITDADITDLHIEGENFYFRVNGVQFSYPTNLDGTTMVFSKSLWIFSYNVNKKRYFHGDIAYFKITDTSSNTKMNLIPCTLTMDLPASMDANNIARTKGTSGMWDLVSDKFYGNVANSGTFKAVNLAEGVDYEVHQWLNCHTADGATLPAQGADIGIAPISLTNKVLTIELGQVSRNVIIYGTSPYSIPMWCMYVNNMYVMRVQERKGNDNTIHNMTCNWTTSNTITFDFINNVATLGNSTFQIEGTGYTFRGFNSAMWQNPRTVGRIKISDELDLVPCKLLKSIPSKYDANGIARNAGECGMYDTVNDVFYGNVASSGSFTVSDDN